MLNFEIRDFFLLMGVEMAYLLFLQRNKVYEERVAAKFKAACQSPSEAAP